MPERPRVLVNVAMSADGKIDSVTRQGAMISSAEDSTRVDRLRAGVDAVLVGGRTLLDQDPRLTLKSAGLRQERLGRGLPENPAKVGVVTVASLNPACRFLTFGPARRLIYTTSQTTPQQAAALRACGVEIFVMGERRVDLTDMMASLYQLGVRSLLVEGGGTILASLFALDLVDELTLYVAPRILGGAAAPTPADGLGFPLDLAPRLQLLSVGRFDAEGGILIHYRVERTP